MALERFVEAQTPVIDTVLAELAAGRKATHWIWFIFPQLAGLGRSPTARYYGLTGREDAAAYLAHPVLGPRLLRCVEVAMRGHPRTAHEIFGSPDDLKFRSCLTLFAAVQGAPEIFGAALDLFYDGPDPATLDLLRTGPN
ncbi:MAG: DUF1810 domain-containing protein [Pseudomonadota bacterium]